MHFVTHSIQKIDFLSDSLDVARSWSTAATDEFSAESDPLFDVVFKWLAAIFSLPACFNAVCLALKKNFVNKIQFLEFSNANHCSGRLQEAL